MNPYFLYDKKDSPNVASLKDLMVTPPMTAELYTTIRLKRTEQRRTIEAARELKEETQRDSW